MSNLGSEGIGLGVCIITISRHLGAFDSSLEAPFNNAELGDCPMQVIPLASRAHSIVYRLFAFQKT